MEEFAHNLIMQILKMASFKEEMDEILVGRSESNKSTYCISSKPKLYFQFHFQRVCRHIVGKIFLITLQGNIIENGRKNVIKS